jgi:RND family efflux transporter MFP subunit
MSTTSTPPETAAQPPRRGGSATRILAGILIVAVLLAVGIVPRMFRGNRALAVAKAAESQLPVVNAFKASLAPGTSELSLPGNTEAVTVARIYPRASGYVRQRLVDIGSQVKAGQTLAVIESPEVDQELAQAHATAEQARAGLQQARANLEQSKASLLQVQSSVTAAQANEEIASTTHQRWDRLVTKGVLPKQAGDERRTTFLARQAETAAANAAVRTAEANVHSQEANVKAAEAAINAQLANVQRLERLQGFQRVVAPFAGVITERNIEQGDLVTADNGASRNLFSVAQALTLRIQVDVPQSYSIDLRPGQPAELSIRERPGQEFRGVVARTASALNNASRTLRVEVQVDNKDGALLPGMYAQVKFALTRSRPIVLIPADTLVANGQGTRVLTVGSGRRVRFVPVTVGRDLGTQIEVLDGLKGSETLVVSPPDTLVDGQEVKLATEEGKRS